MWLVASPLVGFERLNELSLFQKLTNTIYIPPAVRQEVFGSRVVPEWIVEQPLSQPLSSITLSPRLAPGESEAIALALEMQPCYLLLDDLAARRAAQAMSISMIGTVGLLILARQRNQIPLLKPYLDTLLKVEFHISENLYKLALQQVGE